MSPLSFVVLVLAAVAAHGEHDDQQQDDCQQHGSDGEDAQYAGQAAVGGIPEGAAVTVEQKGGVGLCREQDERGQQRQWTGERETVSDCRAAAHV